MASKPVKILLTGPPACGKTTAIRRIVEKLDPGKVAGFYTEEIRENGKRKGFGWKRLDGPEGMLAHVDIRGPLKVGKYGVNIADFERSVVPVLDIGQVDAELFVIDEIGKMECLSKKFVDAVGVLLASDKCVLATVAQKGGGFIREIKQRPDVLLLNLTRDNCDRRITEILGMMPSMQRSGAERTLPCRNA